MQDRIVIHVFGMQADNGLYRGNENQPSPAYLSLVFFFFLFLSFHTLMNEMFRQRFLLNPAS